MTINPYWSDDLATWVFDDPAVGLEKEPFVFGAPAIIDLLVTDIPNDSQMEGWLCPMLFKYFTEAPPRLYAKAEPKEE